MTEADSDLTPASESGSEFTGDLGLPEPEDTGVAEAGSPSEADPAVEDDSSAGEQSEEQVAPQPQGFTLLGRDWESPQAFEQHYKSLEGRVRAQGQEAARLNNLVDQWERWYEYQSTQQPAQAKTETKSEPEKAKEPFLEAVDWQAVKRLNESQGFEAAMQAVVLGLQDHIQNEVVNGVNQRLEKETEPIRRQQEIELADREAKQWFLQSANTVDPETGDPLFPELYEQSEGFNQEMAREIVDAWGELVRTHPHFGLTRDGLEYAVTRGRQRFESKENNKSSAKKAASKVQRNANGQFTKKTESTVTEEASGAITPGDAASEDGKMSEEESIRRAIRNAGKASDKASFFGIA